MRQNNYIVIQAFMRNVLDLKGNELIIYAVIYGFSQDGIHPFRGTRAYLADCAGISKSAVSNILKALTEKGYIDRSERINEYGNTVVEYRANLTIIGGTKNENPQSHSKPPITYFDRGIPEITNPPLPKTDSNDKAKEDTLKDNPKDNIDWLQVEGDSMAYAFAYKCIAAWQTMTGRIAGTLPSAHMDTLELAKDAYTVEDVTAMLEYKRDEWAGSDMAKHFHPSTLFKPELFHKYMGQMLDARDGAAVAAKEPEPMHREIRQTSTGEWEQYDANTKEWGPLKS